MSLMYIDLDDLQGPPLNLSCLMPRPIILNEAIYSMQTIKRGTLARHILWITVKASLTPSLVTLTDGIQQQHRLESVSGPDVLELLADLCRGPVQFFRDGLLLGRLQGVELLT